MVDVIALVNDVSTPIKVAWILLLAWGVVQVGWYRRARVTAPAMRPAPPALPQRPRSAPRKRPSDAVVAPALLEPAAVTAAGAEAPLLPFYGPEAVG